MSVRKTGLAALLVLAGLSGSASAQNFATYSGAGVGYGYSGGYGNYGPSYATPYYGGYGPNGGVYGPYGVGRRGYVGAYRGATPNLNGARVSNNLGGLANIIRQQTGRPGSYRNRRGR